MSTQPSGWNATVTEETGISSVFDFVVIENATSRAHVSPIAFVDSLFLRHPTKFRVCLSIAELASFSFISPLVDGNGRGTLSRECGPGSILIDYAMRYCSSNDHRSDTNGTYAASGNINPNIVDRFLYAHDYLATLPSLRIAQEMFGDHEAQQLVDECLYQSMSDADTLATITRVTAENVLRQYQRLLSFYFPDGQQVDELFIGGPNARNCNIIDHLETTLPESVVTKPLDDVGIPGDANEAVCYAHLALEAVIGQVTRPVAPSAPTIPQPGDAIVQGTVIRGTKWHNISARLERFSRGKQIYVNTDVRCAGNLETAINGLGIR